MAIGNPISIENNYRVNRVSAVGGQTLFTIDGGYTVGKISVYKNGIRLADTIDFSATDASTLTLFSPCLSGDLLVFEILDAFETLNVDSRVGISSAGLFLGKSSSLNFTGAGNTVTVKNDGSIDISISGGARGGGPDKVFQENQTIVSSDYRLTTGYSEMSVGPI